jgi:hypothetical protein
MTATLNRLPGVRQPYYRRLAVRTVQWTVLIVSGLAVAEYTALLLGPGKLSLAIALSCGGAVSLLAYASLVEHQRWAHAPLALLWVAALAVGYAHHGIGNTALIGQVLAMTAATVATVLGLGDVRRQRRSAR